MLKCEYKHKIVIIGVMDGGEKEEKFLHKFFSSLRITGEWFVPSRCIFDFIAANARSWDGIDPPLPVFPERELQTLSSAARLIGMNSNRLKQELKRLCIPFYSFSHMIVIKTKDLDHAALPHKRKHLST